VWGETRKKARELARHMLAVHMCDGRGCQEKLAIDKRKLRVLFRVIALLLAFSLLLGILKITNLWQATATTAGLFTVAYTIKRALLSKTH